jgi:hypothetical protein
MDGRGDVISAVVYCKILPLCFYHCHIYSMMHKGTLSRMTYLQRLIEVAHILSFNISVLFATPH